MTTTSAGSPVLSVVVPAYNVGAWVRECLSSILDDQDADLEVVVVDDGSTDDTWDIVTGFAASHPEVRAVRSPGVGGAQARNYGAEIARGEYLAFADADDLVPRGAYPRMLDAARAGNADMVAGSFLKFYTTRTWRPTWRWPAFHEPRTGVTLADQPSLICNRACWNRVFRRDFWFREGIYFPTVPRSNDIVPMTKALVAAKRIAVVPDTVYLYRDRPGSSSMSSQSAGLDSFVSYLSQEIVCRELVSSVGDATLDREYGRLFARADGWVHLVKFLDGLDTGTADAGGLELAREMLARQISELPQDVLDDLGPAQRWAYGLAAAGHWSLAAELAEHTEDLSKLDPTWFFRADLTSIGSLSLSDAELRKTVNEHVFGPILGGRRRFDPDDAALLAESAVTFRRIFPTESRHWSSEPAQRLTLAVKSGDSSEIEKELRKPLLRFREPVLAVQGGRAVLVTRCTRPELGPPAVVAVRGGHRHVFDTVSFDPETGALTASASLRHLASGPVSIRLQVEDPLGTVETNVTPTLADGSVTRRVLRVLGNGQVDIRHGARRMIRAARGAGRRILQR
ncbi:glycosyltransferase family 2 protein [Myceligenerans pegani]|uniref:Glycosyltransferase n=1 Tax=Myceligenerans pegani TaxID=2776917 RepID=A0ABR9MYA8_9MICO|nr:glycosyltransferase [Myceligenerans sp. TRM 65318]MBE1876374.1 glycosyltransferase [Myceligenerans sp. TRM 65318]MBE3018645.1 glycosyltransferase [Myceligenerans sp. TRM 65318]